MGVFLGPTATEDIEFTLLRAPTIDFSSYTGLQTDVTATLQHSVLGGIGGEIGYRFCTKFRAEIEVLYNNNSFKQLQIGDYVIPGGSQSTTLHIGGDTNTGAGLINIFYDHLTLGRDNYSAVFPYMGAGLGYAYVQNSVQFHYNTPEDLANNPSPPTQTYTETGFTRSYSTYAGQAIIGIGYFLDDFTWLSADIRYFSTGKLLVDLAADRTNTTASFTQQEKLLSIMVSFNGALDLG